MENEIKLSVSYLSQRSDISDLSWQSRACTIVNLKMVLEYYRQEHQNRMIESPSIEDLIAEGVALGGYTDKGWIHNVIVMLARNHGCHAYRQEFRSRNAIVEKRLGEEGIEKIHYTLETGDPVIASVNAGFADNKDSHTILLVGISDEGFYYHDPNADVPEKGAYQFVTTDRFIQYWRKFAIFVY